MISTDKITEIFCYIDEFHKEFEYAQEGHLLEASSLSKEGIENPRFPIAK